VARHPGGSAVGAVRGNTAPRNFAARSATIIPAVLMKPRRENSVDFMVPEMQNAGGRLFVMCGETRGLAGSSAFDQGSCPTFFLAQKTMPITIAVDSLNLFFPFCLLNASCSVAA